MNRKADLYKEIRSLSEVDGTANQQSNNHLIHRLMPPDSEPELSCSRAIHFQNIQEIHSL